MESYPHFIKKGNHVLLQVGLPEDMRYAIITETQYQQNMGSSYDRKNFEYNSADLPFPINHAIEKEIIQQVAFLLNQIVFKVSMDYAIEQNSEILDELEQFQKEYWEYEMQQIDKAFEETLYKQMTQKK